MKNSLLKIFVKVASILNCFFCIFTRLYGRRKRLTWEDKEHYSTCKELCLLEQRTTEAGGLPNVRTSVLRCFGEGLG